LIAPREFLEAAQPLVDLRRAQGLAASAVAVEDVYDEFGYGEAGPQAIQRFLAYAYQSWSPPSLRYVVLLGDSTYDPKDYLGTKVKDRVPFAYVRTSWIWTASDPSYAAVNGDDLVADNADAGGPFEAEQDEAATLLDGREVHKIYLRDLGAGGTRAEILAAFDSGAGLFSYVGHGGTAVWASENVLNDDDMASLRAQSRQPLLLTLNCLNGFFHFPPLNSLAEALVKADGRGAIAAVSPSGLSLDDAAHVYHRALLTEIESGRHERLGDAVLRAHRRAYELGETRLA